MSRRNFSKPIWVIKVLTIDDDCGCLDVAVKKTIIKNSFIFVIYSFLFLLIDLQIDVIFSVKEIYYLIGNRRVVFTSNKTVFVLDVADREVGCIARLRGMVSVVDFSIKAD